MILMHECREDGSARTLAMRWEGVVSSYWQMSPQQQPQENKMAAGLWLVRRSVFENKAETRSDKTFHGPYEALDWFLSKRCANFQEAQYQAFRIVRDRIGETAFLALAKEGMLRIVWRETHPCQVEYRVEGSTGLFLMNSAYKGTLPLKASKKLAGP